MTSIEGLIRELFLRAGAWKRLLLGAALAYVLLAFGYLRRLAKLCGQSAEVELPPLTLDGTFFKQAFAALPLGAFYTLVPVFIGWGTAHLLGILLLWVLIPLVTGLAGVCAISMTAVALVVVEDDPERFVLGLEFEKVLAQWWKLKRYWALPAILGYGFMAIGGALFYGLGYFVAVAVLIAYLSLTIRNLRYA